MISKRRRGALNVGLAACLSVVPALWGCAAEPPHRQPDPPQEQSEKPDSPKAIGKAFLREARKQYRFVKHPDVNRVVSGMGREIVRSIGGDPDAYHFFVIRQSQPNAFAIPGGYIFIFDGLLQRLRGPEELAGVLAHEVAHVRHNHFFSDQGKITALDLATIAAILLSRGDPAAASIALATNVSAKLHYSRQNESEADDSAVGYLERAGYDPAGLMRFMHTLAEYATIHSVEMPAYLSTHPLVGDRVEVLELRLARSGPLAERRAPDPDAWERMQNILRAEARPWREVEDILPLALSLPEAKRDYLQGLAYLTVGRDGEAVEYYRRAVERSPMNPRLSADLAWASLRFQRSDEAQSNARNSLANGATESAAALANLVLGLIEMESGRADAAENRFREATEADPMNAAGHYQLSRSLSQLGRHAESGYHMARYFRIELEPEKAISELRRAKGHAVDEGLRNRIDREIEDLAREGI